MVDVEHEGKVDWRYLRRRFLSVRSIVWVLMVLAVAFGLNYLFPDPAADVEPVDRGPEAAASHAEPPSMSAVEP